MYFPYVPSTVMKLTEKFKNTVHYAWKIQKYTATNIKEVKKILIFLLFCEILYLKLIKENDYVMI